MKFLCLIFALLSLLYQANALKILAIVPFPSKSHFAIGHAIVKSLVDAGEIFLINIKSEKD